MYVSARFRDIFGSGAIKIRRTDSPLAVERSVPLEESGFAGRHTDVDAIWLDITAAHRRAARTFTPEFIRLADLAADER